MVFYFVSIDPQYILYMGKDKFENEELIKWAFPEDIWFHVDDLSSAHVYLRLPPGQTMDKIPAPVLEDCVQLVKANSIQGNKQSNLSVVYTPASNLKKTGSMDVGQVGFKDEKLCRHAKVSARDNAIVNRLNKTKEERQVNLQALREERDAAERQAKKKEIIRQKEIEAKQIAEKKREQELRSYTGLVDDEAHKISNKNNKSAKEFEDDFM